LTVNQQAADSAPAKIEQDFAQRLFAAFLSVGRFDLKPAQRNWIVRSDSPFTRWMIRKEYNFRFFEREPYRRNT
jgi:hypothetical protein